MRPRTLEVYLLLALTGFLASTIAVGVVERAEGT
jgi:hypothetical protein